MSRLAVLFLLGLGLVTAAHRPASAATTCWQVTGWSSTSYVGAQAIVVPADCTTVPLTHGWTEISMSYGAPPTDTIWFRISLTDSRVTAGVFAPLLVFAGYSGTTPIVQTDLIPCIGCNNTTPLLHRPPLQGVPVAGSKVRLRHLDTDLCIKTSATNGQAATGQACTNATNLTFVLDASGGGFYRLRNASTSQCLYTLGINGSSVFHWGCWADPYMRFALDPATGAYRLRSVSYSQCAYNAASSVFSWVCWADPNMRYAVDVIQY